MKRRFNYTGRIRIPRKRIEIIFNRQNGKITSFVLNKLDLQEFNLPPDSKIYVEAYYRTELKRFEYGVVRDIKPGQTGDLGDMAYTENLKFRIIIANPSNWKILAHADRIAPEPAETKSILPVEFCDLGNLVWRIEYEGDDGGPILCINSKIPDVENMAKRDSGFFMHVYPSAIREILTHMVFVEGVDSVTDPSSDWHKNWLTFSRMPGADPPEVLDPKNQDFEKEKALEWIDDIVENFCNKYASRFSEFVKLFTQTEETP